ncbi:hypothetical protein LCGC14_0608720 [marine sediment metagenome]|uniref:Uncharacterized protein n=1 Tax=marine sediment metagenome TaxID=412755 RepID=A0A0F9UGV9_9ZZZZ
MEVIHFETDGQVGINLSGKELPNGDVQLLRVFQTGDPTKTQPPETFIIRAEECEDLMQYLMGITHSI